MASLSERLHYYRLCYHELRATQSRISPGQPQNLETRLRQAELRCLEELILICANVNPNTTNEIDSRKPETQWDLLDVSLVTNILLLSPPSPWMVYVVDRSTPNLQVHYVSPSVKRLLGWLPSDMVGKPIFEGCYPDDVQVLEHIFQPKVSSSRRAARPHVFGEYVTLRRMRRDQTVAFLHGTSIVIDSRWYAWVEQDTIELKLALVRSSLTLIDEKSYNNKQQPTRTLGEGRVVELKVEGVQIKETMTRDAPMKPSSSAMVTKSMELKSRKAIGNSCADSLPTHIVMSPHAQDTQARKLNSANDKSLDLIKGKRVLVVDDSATYLKGAQALLRKMGCDVFVATNGEEALEIMKHAPPKADLPHHFDIIFMDLSMPKMDGIQVVKLFRIWEGNQPPGRAPTLIIAVTANDTDGGMVLCAQTGFDGFVTKPLTKKKILDCLATSAS